MSHTNTTTNFGLPQFITTDKPAWLTDVNVAYQAIDTAMKNNQTAAASAQGDATQALSDASGAQTTANSAESKASGAIVSISEAFLDSATYEVGDLVMYNNLLYKCHTAVETPGAWTGNTNWVRTDVDTVVHDLDDSISTVGKTNNFNDLNNRPTRGSYLGYIDVTINGITIGADGFINISSYKPALPEGFQMMCAVVSTYGATTNHYGAMTVNSDGNYLNGAPNTGLNYVTIRYIYIKT